MYLYTVHFPANKFILSSTSHNKISIGGNTFIRNANMDKISLQEHGFILPCIKSLIMLISQLYILLSYKKNYSTFKVWEKTHRQRYDYAVWQFFLVLTQRYDYAEESNWEEQTWVWQYLSPWNQESVICF